MNRQRQILYSVIAASGIIFFASGTTSAEDIKLATSHPDSVRMRGQGDEDHRHLDKNLKPLGLSSSSPTSQAAGLQEKKIKTIGRQLLEAREKTAQTEEEKQFREKLVTLNKALIAHKEALRMDLPPKDITSIEGQALRLHPSQASSDTRTAIDEARKQLKTSLPLLGQKTLQDHKAEDRTNKLEKRLNTIESEIDLIMKDPSPEHLARLDTIINQLEVKPRMKINEHPPTILSSSNQR